MQRVSSIKLDSTRFDKHCLTLTPSQHKFASLVQNCLKDPRKMLVMISGGPGTGKTYTVSNLSECIHVKQLRMAFTARTAHAIKGRTVHSTVKLDWGPGSILKRLLKELEEEQDVQVCIEKSRLILDEFSCDVDPFIIIVD